MKKVGGLFTCSALALMAFAALPLCAAELTHRWSFNGDYSDSVGGADAVKCGTYVSLYTGYVDLGTNMLDTTAATIEIWARHDGVENWSRVFDYGKDLTSRGYSWPITTASSATTEYSAAIL